MTRKNQPLTSCYVVPGNQRSTLGPQPAKKKKKKRRNRRRGNRNSACVVPRSLPDSDFHKLTGAIAGRVACACNPNYSPRYYDDNSRRLIPLKLVTRYPFRTVGTTGNAAVEIQPDLNALIKEASTFSGSSVATWSSTTAATGWNADIYSSYRIVNICARYFATTSPSDSAGIIAMISSSPRDTTPDVFSSAYSQYHQVRQYQADVMMCAKPEGPETKKHAVSTAGAGGGWPYLYILGRGLPQTDNVKAGEIEITIALEAHVESGDALNFALQPAGAHLPQLEMAVNNAQAQVPVILDNTNNPEAAKKTIWAAAEESAIDLVKSLTPYAIESLIALI